MEILEAARLRRRSFHLPRRRSPFCAVDNVLLLYILVYTVIFSKKMNTTIQKWGNSQGLRLKKEVLDALNLSAGDQIKVSVKSGSIVISPAKKKRKKVDLNKLLAKVPKDYKPKEIDWGSPVGKEIW